MDKDKKPTPDPALALGNAAGPSNLQKQMEIAKQIYGPKPEGEIMNHHFIKD